MNIAQQLTALNNAKQDIKAAIIEKGQTVGDNMNDYAEAIGNISGGEVDDADYLCFEAIEDSAVSMSIYGASTPNFEYSLDKSTWTTWDYSNIDLPEGSIVFFRGDNPDGFNVRGDFSSCATFSGTGKVNLSGNIMTLIDKTGMTVEMPNDTTTASQQLIFYKLFYNNLTLHDCSNLVLPSKVALNRCYHSMFRQASLVYPPQVLVNNAQDYSLGAMFYNCPSLIQTPYLNISTLSTTVGPLNECFRLCSSLQYAKIEFTPSTVVSNSWLDGTASSGCMIKAKGSTWTTKSSSACPSGWTLITSVS